VGFNGAKRKLIECLNTGYVLHEERNDIDVHVLVTKFSVQAWYVKWYFLGPDSVFISFHQ
jgi:hypothetical protein